jgi:tRNA 2-selenouridine synthase
LLLLSSKAKKYQAFMDNADAAEPFHEVKGHSLSVNSFLEKRNAGNPVVDVRSPGEFARGHIPGAINMPLFSNEERAVVGSLYTKKGKEDALQVSLEIIGPKLKDFAKQGISLAARHEILIYCWRGGMRSASMAWLFKTAGLKAYVLTGGYKSYRRFVHDYLSSPFQFIVIGGMTGSGKTEILRELGKMGYTMVDLEELASHKGSVFGAIGEGAQPTTEQFENLLFENLWLKNKNNPIFLEDESIAIGSVFLPKIFHQRMLQCPLVTIGVPYEDRVHRLVNLYTGVDKDILIAALHSIEKRLGTENMHKAIGLIAQGRFEEAVFIVLNYYDKMYFKTMQHHHKDKKTITLELTKSNATENAKQIVACVNHENLL